MDLILSKYKFDKVTITKPRLLTFPESTGVDKHFMDFFGKGYVNGTTVTG